MGLKGNEDPENTVKIAKDSKGVITIIYIQLKIQKKWYNLFGEVCQLDGTYRLLRICMYSLYTVMVSDNNGNGQPVAFFLVRDETKKSIKQGLKMFAKVSPISLNFLNDTSITLIFVNRRILQQK